VRGPTGVSATVTAALPFGGWDGHCHSGYSPHGSGDPTERFVLAAVASGLRRLTLLEHPLAPPSLPASLREAIYLEPERLEAFLREASDLKRRMADHIDLRIGLELDYFPTFPDFSRDVLDAYGGWLDDAVLSLHFLPDGDRLRPLDVDPAEVGALVAHAGSVAALRERYWETLAEAIRRAAAWGPKAPRRVAQLDVVGKYEGRFAPPPPAREEGRVREVLALMVRHGFALEVNAQGVDVPGRHRPYPAPWIVRLAAHMGLTLVYGSDAHRPQDVGRHRHALARLADVGPP
jgi:histidinol-phosphatase (PHP family)